MLFTGQAIQEKAQLFLQGILHHDSKTGRFIHCSEPPDQDFILTSLYVSVARGSAS